MSSSWLPTNVFWQAAGWTLLHFLWAGGLFVLFATLVELATRRCSHELRYSLTLTQLLMIAMIPCCLLAWKMNSLRESSDSAATRISEVGQIAATLPLDSNRPKFNDELTLVGDDSSQSASRLSGDTELAAVPSRFESASKFIMNFEAYAADWLLIVLPCIWLVGFPLACCTLLLGVSGAERLRHRCQILDKDHPAVTICRRLQTALNLRERVLIGTTDRISSPILVGIVRPLILFPASTLAGISPAQLEMVLLHELAHVRRWDNLINLMQRVIESVLFFHPAVWWLSNRVRLEREHCCDFVVLAHVGTPHNYAEMLVQMAISNSKSGCLMGTSVSHQLIPRIRRVLNQEENRTQVSRKMIMASLSALLSLAIATIANAQRDPIKSQEKPDQAIAAPESVKQNTIPAKSEDASPRTTIHVADRDGRPIEAGTVRLSGDTRTGAYFEQTISIREGMAVVPLKSDEVEHMTLTIKSPGYLTYLRKFVPEKEQRYLLVAGEYMFTIKPGIPIGGRVESQTGVLIANAEVYASCPSRGRIEDGIDTFEQRASTDDAGKWKILGAPEGLERLALRITHPSQRPDLDVPLVGLRPEERDRLTSFTDVRTLDVQPTTTAIVQDPDGKPVSGALILFAGRHFYQDHAADRIPKTDATGSFQLPAAKSDSLVLTIFSPNWALHPLKVEFPLKAPLKVTLQKGHRVAFRTLDAQGAPVAGISFYPERPRLTPFEGDREANYLYVLDYLCHRDLLNHTSDENGNFVWENAPRERLGYQITSSKYLSQPGGEYGPSDSPHTLRFRPIIPLEITIVDDESGQPIQDYKVHQGTHFKANPPKHWAWNFERPQKANPPGRYPDFLGCLDRVIQYRIEADGYQPGLTPIYDAKELPDKAISVEVRLKKLEQ